MIIKEKRCSEPLAKTQEGDLLNAEKINALGTCSVVLLGGFECGLETVDVETGLCRFDVCGQIDIGDFADIRELIDYDGNRHDVDDFYKD